MILGTISAVDADNGLQLIIDGEDLPTTKKYTYMASYVPTANDRVLIEEINGSYVIIGKVINEVASSGIARVSETANNAINATNAQNALTATNATTADGLNGNNYGKVAGSLIARYTQGYNSQIGYYIQSIELADNGANYIYEK